MESNLEWTAISKYQNVNESLNSKFDLANLEWTAISKYQNVNESLNSKFDLAN